MPWKQLSALGVDVVVATPDGAPAEADPIVLSGEGLGLFSFALRADTLGRGAYEEFQSEMCRHPQSYGEVDAADFDALILPGGHAKEMRPYLESEALHAHVSEFFRRDKIVAAICHGVVAAARARSAEGTSVLAGKRTTALTEAMELFAWRATRRKLGDYYRTYPQTVQDEVSGAVGDAGEFLVGPKPLFRDRPGKLHRGFVVQDGNYISARYPGDVHRFSDAISSAIAQG